MQQAPFREIGLVLLAAMAVEAQWALWHGRKIYAGKEVAANLGLLVGNQLLKPLSLGWKAVVFAWLEPLRLWTMPLNAGTLVLTFLSVELVYYGYHRFSHEVPLLWTVHHAHHSSTHMNLTTAVRLNWMGAFLGPLLYGPLVVLGFPAKAVIASLALGLLYQFFLHTEMIGKLGFLEGLLVNTPSAHRVHHGRNPAYLDKNYGAVLIIYDRLFGTYQGETEPPAYGVTTGPVAPNPLVIVFAPLLRYLWARGTSGLVNPPEPR